MNMIFNTGNELLASKCFGFARVLSAVSQNAVPVYGGAVLCDAQQARVSGRILLVLMGRF